ncbi:MAG: hypothetical protein OEW86_00480 [Nitrosopumilus sp.]|nr:hypothetical protein [Nitrosopumilus sp.]MDH3516558.1 hypothetical protein [Nitrosopumilus sp.]MDH3565025.1 hypothetical protein [Nitrosopumilus sp.]MDH5416448.1 hypothetical protein [Nitrosopumilus sp.]MDH5553646.1 hypothetical protein [Nitrosopumilus sp.]
MAHSFLLDAQIAYYCTLSKIIQYKKNFMKIGLSIMPNKILAKEVYA